MVAFTVSRTACLVQRASVAPRATRRGAVVVSAKLEGNWFPGSETPAYLANSKAPGVYGFDPLGLAEKPENLARYQESEVIHSRFAMLGVAGVLAAELVAGNGSWVSVQADIAAGKHATYFGADVPFDLSTIVAVNFIAMAGAESFRSNATGQNRVYPAGAFDPMGMAKGDVESAKLKEIKNGRLAMVAFLGFLAQWSATGKGPIEALTEHIASPFTANFTSNGVSLPESIF